MLFHVRMDVELPHDLPQAQKDDLIAREKAYAQDLQQRGIWRHIWRIAGAYANYSIFDVRDNAHLHEILSGLPLFSFMTLTVSPLLRHPSAIREDDS